MLEASTLRVVFVLHDLFVVKVCNNKYMLIERDYLERIRPYYNSEQIKALVGVRRCGKTTLMLQIMEDLKREVGEDRVFYLDLESYESVIYRSDPMRFYTMLKEYVSGKERCYVFLDEVHKLEDYENVIASIRSSLKCSLFVACSSSKLMIGQMTKTLTGRIMTFYVSPFQYSEVLELIGEEDSAELFEFYLLWGGFPLVYKEFRSNPKKYLGDLYEMILLQDIFNDMNIRGREEFRKLASYLFVHAGEIISRDSLSSFIKAHEGTISLKTCYQYINNIEETFLLRICRRYDIRGKEILSMKQKYYPVDSGLISVHEGNANINRANLLEDIVYNELIYRGYEVYVGKTYKGEIDFVVLDSALKCYIQVAYSIAESEVFRREFDAFKSIKDLCPRYVITTDSFDNSRDGITHLNIRDFLTGRRNIALG